MSRYFRAQALVAAIVGVLFAIGFTLVGLPMGILLGLFIGLLNMVPYLQLVGLVPAGLLAVMHGLESGGDIWIILAQTGLVFVVAQAVQDVLLVPRIMGRVTGLSPAFILLALAVWGKLLGPFWGCSSPFPPPACVWPGTGGIWPRPRWRPGRLKRSPTRLLDLSL